MIDLAKYTCDAVTGSEYLPQETRERRMQQFRDRLNSLSETMAEDVVDNCMYAAARISWKLGVPKVVGLLKNLKGASDHFAERFMRHFDQVIQDNPVMITAEGAIVVPATQEATWGQSITRAIWGAPKNEINSVDGLMSFLESEKKYGPAGTELSKQFLDEIKIKINDSCHKTKKISDSAIDLNHIFQESHIKDGIFDLGFNEEDILKKCVKIIQDIDFQKLFTEQSNQIETLINGKPTTIRLFIRNNEIINLDLWVGHSQRKLGNLILWNL